MGRITTAPLDSRVRGNPGFLNYDANDFDDGVLWEGVLR